MCALHETFLRSTHDVAVEHGCQHRLNALEVCVLGTFFVSEVYLTFSQDQEAARATLDEFHKFAAEDLLNSNLPALQKRFPDRSGDALYDQFVELFHSTVRKRYTEFRSILLNENGSFKRSEAGLFEVCKYFMTYSSDVDPDPKQLLPMFFGVAALDHFSRCTKSFRR